MAKRYKLIFNPIANLGRAWANAAELRPIAEEFGGADWTGTVYPTHAIELARQAGEQGYDVVVAMGGDGTVHEVVNGLMQIPAERRPLLGVVPLGSGNDFSHALGISEKPAQALRQVFTGAAVSADLGLVRDEQGRQQYWCNAVGIGVDTMVTLHTRKIRWLHGFPVFVAATLQTIFFDNIIFRLEMQTENEAINEEMMLLVLCNGGREGGGFQIAPQASATDGLLDYLKVNRVSRFKMLTTMLEVMKGTQGRLPHCKLGNFTRLTLKGDRPLFIHVDGEIYASDKTTVRQIEVEILPGAIQAIR